MPTFDTVPSLVVHSSSQKHKKFESPLDDLRDSALEGSLKEDWSLTDDNQNVGQSRNLSANALQPGLKTHLEEDEKGDAATELVSKLNKSWSIAPQLFRRRSCEMMLIMGPCVEKAVSHLEMVQDLIEQWFKKGRQLMSGGGPDTDGNMDEQRRSTAVVSYEDITRISSCDSMISAITEGESTISRSDTKLTDERDTVLASVGAEDVIDEVMTLLARLEKDRQDTEFSYINECTTVSQLNTRIVQEARLRLIDLAARVQKEHEACIADMNELQWHVNYYERMRDRMVSKTKTAANFNNRLKEDISFVNKHIPLMEEKLLLEREAKAKIDNALIEAKEELNFTKQRLASTQSKSHEAHTKAEQERERMSKELKALEEQLAKLSKELTDLITQSKAYKNDIESYKSKTDALKQEKKYLDVETEIMREKEDMQCKLVIKLETELSQVSAEQQNILQYNKEKKKKLTVKSKMNQEVIYELDKKISVESGLERDLEKKIKDLTFQIEESGFKIKTCDNEIAQYSKDVARIEREKKTIIDNIQETEKVFESMNVVTTQKHDNHQVELARQAEIEDALRHTADALKRQLKDENHTRSILQARITTDSAELQRARKETASKTDKANSVVAEVENALFKLRNKVDDMRIRRKKNTKTQSKMKTKITVTKTKTEKKTVEHKMTVEEKIPEIEIREKEIKKSEKRIETIELKMKEMQKHTEEMDESAKIMEKVLDNTGKQNKNLQFERNEAKLQADAATKIYNDLEALFNDLNARIKDNAQKQRELIQSRRYYHQQQKDEKTERLEENKKLASLYRKTQNDYYDSKNKLLNVFDEKVKFEKCLRNLRQLLSLQQRMHAALVSYFKYRNLYNNCEVNKLEFMSNSSNDVIDGIKLEMEEAMNKMTQFLTSEVKTHAGSVLPELKIVATSPDHDWVTLQDFTLS